jgi:uncharacterized protein
MYFLIPNEPVQPWIQSLPCMTSKHQDRLLQVLAAKKKVLVSYSGGVDSTVLAAAAREALGSNSRCILLDSPLVPRRTVQKAVARAKALGLDCEVQRFPILENPLFLENQENRCYLCKKLSGRVLRKIAEELGDACVIDGVQLSDLEEFRPGLVACREEGISHPLAEAGMSKDDIRAAARETGYDFWEEPSTACLASRIPYGERISEDILKMIEKAEELLHDLGFTQVRVRTYGTMARIEILPDQFDRILSYRNEIVHSLNNLGYDYVTLDLEGFRSGSMDKHVQGSDRISG